ncbi:MAG TPA: hypothetical protein VM737_06980 [Gemmatimonadota bacterium]|nr:hypothetical protein [Gemmatimonadota bacterium]
MRLTLILLLALLFAAACEGVSRSPDSEAMIPPATFARLLAELVAARVETLPDTVRYQTRRAAILQEAGVTAADLRRFVEARGGDGDLMAAVYRVTAVRLDTLAARRTLSPAADSGPGLPQPGADP